MTIHIRGGDLDADRDLLIGFLREHLTHESDEKRFDWLYLSNPAGPAFARIAMDDQEGGAIGVAAAFPRMIHLGTDLLMGWVFGDFCIAPEYRSAGPALALQRALIDGVRHTGAGLYYDFPSQGMLAIYHRLGIEKFGQLARFIRHIRAEPIAQRIVANPSIANLVAVLLDPFMKRMSSDSAVPKSLETGVHPGRFAAEFSALDQRLDRRDQARIARTAEYLNWRFRESPHQSYLVMSARSRGVLVGFSVCQIQNDAATIVDISALDEDSTAGILRATVAHLRNSTRAKTVHFPLLRTSPLAVLAVREGFRERESAPVVLSAADAGKLTANFLDPRNWFMTNSDRDS